MQTFNTHFTLADGRVCYLSEFDHNHIDSVLKIEQRASSNPWSRQNLCDSVNSSHLCSYVQLGSRGVAFAISSCAAGEAELLLLAVEPDYQRLGIAQGLLDCLQAHLAIYARELFLEVRESNTQAIALYEKLGFNCVGRRPRYYPPLGKSPAREDALIYARHLRTADDTNF